MSNNPIKSPLNFIILICKQTSIKYTKIPLPKLSRGIILLYKPNYLDSLIEACGAISKRGKDIVISYQHKDKNYCFARLFHE